VGTQNPVLRVYFHHQLALNSLGKYLFLRVLNSAHKTSVVKATINFYTSVRKPTLWITM